MSKHYIVTGAAGFIGYQFVRSCRERFGDEIQLTSVDDASLFDQHPEHRGVDWGDQVDRSELNTWLERLGTPPSAIVHMGACSDTMQLDPKVHERWNLKYSQDLWNYCVEHQVPFVYASSAATYGDGSKGYEDREDRMSELEPLNPYGQSKLDFDLWALEQENAGQCPPSWAGFKFFNVYGFGERHKGRMASMVLHLFDQVRKDGEARLFKSYRDDYEHGQQKRDFVWVGDVTSVLHFALDQPIKRGVFNLGSGQARSWVDLAQAVFASLEKEANIQFIEMPEQLRERYQYFTQATMERLKAEGYQQPFSTLEEGVKNTITELRERT
jgi:ADP-L-glycero-D-manno-heptose 6-epimerase